MCDEKYFSDPTFTIVFHLYTHPHTLTPSHTAPEAAAISGGGECSGSDWLRQHHPGLRAAWGRCRDVHGYLPVWGGAAVVQHGHTGVCVCVCVCVCVRACVRACVRVCVCVKDGLEYGVGGEHIHVIMTSVVISHSCWYVQTIYEYVWGICLCSIVAAASESTRVWEGDCHGDELCWGPERTGSHSCRCTGKHTWVSWTRGTKLLYVIAIYNHTD